MWEYTQKHLSHVGPAPTSLVSGPRVRFLGLDLLCTAFGAPGCKKWKAIIMARMDEDGVLGDKHRTLELPKLFLSFSTLWLGGRMNPDVRGALRMSTHLEVPYLSQAICAAILMPLLQYSVGGLGHESPSPTSCI